MRRRNSRTLAAALALAVGPMGHTARAQVKIDSAVFGALEARPIGPAVTSGRIAALDGVNRDPRILYAGAAAGGVWKTTNGGLTFRPVFDRNPQSIGAIAVDQAKPETVWVGTGESWVRNSVSVGAGLYKTTEGGDNWQFIGSRDRKGAVGQGMSVVTGQHSASARGAMWADSRRLIAYRQEDQVLSPADVHFRRRGTARFLACFPQTDVVVRPF